jgi:hypothetical protein
MLALAFVGMRARCKSHLASGAYMARRIGEALVSVGCSSE